MNQSEFALRPLREILFRAHNWLTMATPAQESNQSLGERLRARIKREGAISFHDWMQAALYDKHEGYYCRSDLVRWGREGDYRTAPERSPLFGATFASYFAKLYTDLGSPKSLTIIEVGAGAGDFARDVLMGLQSNYPTIFAVTSYLIDEISPDDRSRAELNLAEFRDTVEFLSLSEITQPIADVIVFSNELIDAFPVYHVVNRRGKLRELCVGLDESAFVWLESDPPASVSEYCERAQLHLAEDQIAEINLGAEKFISLAASFVERGYVITVDYGAERNELLNDPYRPEGTLRAFHRHQHVNNVFAKPGEQDLTTTVDWTQIKEAGELAGLQTVRYESLHRFLLDEGLLEEINRLSGARPDHSEVLRLRTSAREMIMPHGMAASFQVLVQKKLN